MRFPFSSSLAGALLVQALPAAATPLPPTLPEAGAAVAALAAQPLERADSERVSGRLVSLAHDVRLDEHGGFVTTTSVTLQAVDVPVSELVLRFEDLTLGEASAYERDVSIVPSAGGATLRLSHPVDPGRLLTIQLASSGRSEVSAELSLLSEGDELPAVAAGGGLVTRDAERLLVVRRPSEVDVVASGEALAEVQRVDERVSHFFTPAWSGSAGQIVAVGHEARRLSSSPPVTLQTGDLEPLAGWIESSLSRLSERVGALPFGELGVVSVPRARQPGVAHAVVLLDAAHGDFGVRYQKEVFAHQLAHQWWGVVAKPEEAARTRLLDEGLATLFQVDSQADLAPDREDYLARRYREHAALLRQHGPLPAPVVATESEVPTDPRTRTLWEYLWTSATLEHLRTGVGDASFDAALADWAGECMRGSCTLSDLRRALRAQSGLDLAAAFEHYVYGNEQPAPAIGFEQPAPDRLRVTFDGELVGPLELFVELQDGQRLRRRVMVEPVVEISVPGPVRSVRPNPRHDARIWSRSAVDGDVDFDGEVDGVDVMRCAFALGRSAEPRGTAGEGFFDVDLDFDPRCDRDGDGLVSEQDLDAVAARLGSLREAR